MQNNELRARVQEQLAARVEACEGKLDVRVKDGDIVVLEGQVPEWRDVVDLGHQAAKVDGVRNVVNHLEIPDMAAYRKDYSQSLEAGLQKGVIADCDVVIVGAGISGCGIARELSKYDLDIVVVEKNLDVAEGATRANNGDIHPGHKAKPGTLKARLNVLGNEMYDRWAEELDFDLKRIGAISFAYDEDDLPKVQKIYDDGVANGVPGMELFSGEELKRREPGVKGEPLMAVLAPTMGVVEPYLVTIALAENAAENGVKFIFDAEVANVLIEDQRIAGVVTKQGIVRAKYLINAAGIYADDIAVMADDEFFTIHGRRGTILLLDKGIQGVLKGTLGSVPKAKNPDSKGGGAQTTVEGNILLGPSASEIPDKEDLGFNPEDLEYALGRGMDVVEGIQRRDVIAIFSGIRPADYTEDFIIEASRHVKGLIHCAAIQSPGLASAPAIAELVENILKAERAADGQPLERKASFNPIRKRKPEFRKLSREEQAKLIEENPKYGQIICRCEQITAGEILDCMDSLIPPRSIDAIKRRTRAGMGRCQGGFCQPRVVELLAEALQTDWCKINLKEAGSEVLLKNTREFTEEVQDA
ncbi:MAG: FAD-dependent oxidoreductase [Eubacteriales bacterium]|nr:FAD-dependent oxidoreductase [Eubacteriales bacterium]